MAHIQSFVTSLVFKIHTNRLFCLIIALSVILAFYTINSESIFFTDELLIEDISYSMAHGGSWITPQLNGEVYLTKPPLLYWLTAPLYIIVNGSPPWAYRLWTAFFGVLLICITYVLANHWYNKEIALWSAFILAVSPFFIIFTKSGNYDLPNAFFVTLTIYLYIVGKKREKFLFLAAVAQALGVLTRSFLALIPIGIISFDYFFYPKERPNTKILFASLILCVMLILPWHITAYLKYPQQFFSQYIHLPLAHHALGLAPGDEPSTLLFYIRILFFFPATLFILTILNRTIIAGMFKRKRINYVHKSDLTSLTVWIAIVFIVLTVSPTRHEWYTFPVYPPLSIIASIVIIRVLRRIIQQSVNYYIMSWAITVFFLALPFSLLLFKLPLPSADPITAISVMESNSQPQNILYYWQNEIVPITRFYPHRKVKIINRHDAGLLKQSKEPVFILIHNSKVKELPLFENQNILYKGTDYSLVVSK